MGVGLTDLSRSGRVDLWRMEIADELGMPITKDCGVRNSDNPAPVDPTNYPCERGPLSAHYAGRIK